MWGVLAAATVAVLSFAPSAVAQGEAPPPPSPFGVTATVGAQGFVDPDAAVTVLVDVSADQLLVGTVEARMGRARAATSVEVPAGSAKRYPLELPAPGNLRQVVVTLTPDGGTEQSTTLRMQVPADALLVGLLDAADAAANVRAAATTPLERTPTVVSLDATGLQAALAVIPYLVAGPGALDRLDDAAAEQVARWLAGGGRLFAPAADLRRFAEPEAGDPLPGGVAVVTPVGAGEVGAIDDPSDLDRGEWSTILRDVPPIGLVQDYTRQNTDSALLAAATAGQEANVPALPWLLGGIALFVVLVGPVNFVALRAMGRPEFAWVTVPLLSAVFAAGFWVVGTGQIKDFTVGHASVLIDDGAGGRGHSVVTLQTEQGGDHSLGFPEGWTAALADTGAAAATETGDGTVLTVEMEDLGFVAATGRWAAEDTGVRVITAIVDDGVEVTVINESDTAYWTWGVVVGGRAIATDDPLEAGATATLTVQPGRASAPYDPVLSSAVFSGGYSVGPGFSDADYQAVYQLASVAEAMVPDLRGATAFFFGFTDDRSPEIGVDGETVGADGPTLVVRRIVLDADALVALGRAQPSLLAVTGASTIEGYYGEVYAYGAKSVVFRYLLPDRVPGAVRVSPGFTALDRVEAFDWDAGEYVAVAWNADIATTGLVSASGEMVLRAGMEDPDRFFDESLQLDRFAVTWSTL